MLAALAHLQEALEQMALAAARAAADDAGPKRLQPGPIALFAIFGRDRRHIGLQMLASI